jgi:hypothetical protein
MKQMLVVVFVMAACSVQSFSQTAYLDLALNPFGDFKAYSEWKVVESTSKSPQKIEYRYVVNSRVGVGCNYVIELKNTGDDKIKGTLFFNYRTLMFPTDLKSKAKFSIKPGEIEGVKFQVEGCKKQEKEQTPWQSCTGCTFECKLVLE